MSQIRGKQIQDQSVVLDKLSGTGSVTFTGGSMVFNSGVTLQRATADISANTDVVNKEYVDSVASGLEVKEAARAIATSAITLSGTQTIDGVELIAGDRVVVNGQGDDTANGIYVVASGAWSRATDMDEPAEVNGGEFVFVKEGNTYADTGWVVSSPDTDMATIGDASINFTQFSSAGVINAGLGLLQTGNTFDIITGVGLTASANELKLDDTDVTAGSYGAAGTVSTFTVDDQGRLTAADEVSIEITASQVSDFDAEVLNSVFEDANFVDTDTVNFTVTSGTDVTADVNVNTATGLDVGASGIEINYGAGLTVSGNQLIVDSTTFGVQGADNGLSIDGSSNVVLGGTLSQNTLIFGDSTHDLNFDNINDFSVTDAGSVLVSSDGNVDLSSTGNFLVTSGAGLDADVTGNVGLTASGNVTVDATDLTATATNLTATLTGDLTLDSNYSQVSVTTGLDLDGSALAATFSTLALNANSGVYTDTNTGNKEGLKYAADYSATFVDRSLVDKEYVDTAVTNSTYFAGDGLALTGLTFSADLDSDALQITSGKIDLKDTITGDRTFSDSVTINGNLTVSGTVSTVNSEELLVEDNVITLNNGEAGAGVTSGKSGIEIDRGSETFAKLIFQESDDLFYAGLSGSLHAVVTEAGAGLTQSGNVLSVDYDTVALATGGVGLTANGSVLDVTAGNGLTADSGQDRVKLGGTLDENTSIDGASNSFTLNKADTITFNTAVNSGNIVLKTDNQTSNIVIEATTTDSTVDIDAGKSVTIDSAAVDLTATNTFSLSFTSSTVTDTGDGYGLRYDGNYHVTYVDRSLVDKEYVDLGTASIWSAIDEITGTNIDQITAGAGLAGGGTQGNVELSIGTGAGIQVNADGVEVDITTGGGLTFSGSGTASTLEVQVDGTTIDIVDGALTVIAGSAQPVYQLETPNAAAGVNGTGALTGVTLSDTPNDYSRIEVYVNGQRQYLGENTNADCWFGSASSAKSLSGLVSTDELVWNSQSAGFKLDASDRVEIVYEA